MKSSMLRSYNTLLELNIEIATGVVKGIRDNSNIVVFKIGGIINIEFLYFTFFLNRNTGWDILR